MADLRNHGEDEDSLTNMMGVAQALISIFQTDGDAPRMIVHGNSKVVFNIKDNLYFFAVSDWGEPEYIVSPSDHHSSDASSACTSST